jgi:hypothetical protein
LDYPQRQPRKDADDGDVMVGGTKLPRHPSPQS